MTVTGLAREPRTAGAVLDDPSSDKPCMDDEQWAAARRRFLVRHPGGELWAQEIV